MVARVVHSLVLPELVIGIAGRELRGKNQHIPILALFHPLAKPFLRLLILVVVGRINEVAAGVVVCVEELKGLFLVHGAHETLPGFAKGHSS